VPHIGEVRLGENVNPNPKVAHIRSAFFILILPYIAQEVREQEHSSELGLPDYSSF
jgi:hypothetical protein